MSRNLENLCTYINLYKIFQECECLENRYLRYLGVLGISTVNFPYFPLSIFITLLVQNGSTEVVRSFLAKIQKPADI